LEYLKVIYLQDNTDGRAVYGVSLRPLDREYELLYCMFAFVVYCIGSSFCDELISTLEKIYRVCVKLCAMYKPHQRGAVVTSPKKNLQLPDENRDPNWEHSEPAEETLNKHDEVLCPCHPVVPQQHKFHTSFNS